MSIIASAPVPAQNRLSDADTQVLTGPAGIAWQAISTEGATAATVARVAVQLGVTTSEVYQLALDHIAAQTGWTAGQKRHAAARIPANPALCPAWCSVDHTEDGTERMHARDLAELTAAGGDDLHEEQTITLQIEAFESPALPGGIDPTSIYLAMGAAGGTDSSATLTPEHAEQLAAALFEAARIARQARR